MGCHNTIWCISINPFGIDVRGDGIKYYYTTDNDEYGGNGDSFIHIKTLEIDLVIPGTASPETAIAIIHGMVSIPDPGESPEYIGEISLKLPKAKIAGGAAMRLQPRYPAFLIDVYIDLPASAAARLHYIPSSFKESRNYF